MNDKTILWGELEPKIEEYIAPDVSEDILKAMQTDCLSTFDIKEEAMEEEDLKIE